MLLSLLATSATIILSLFTGRRWLFLWVALFRRYRPANVPVTETNVLVVVPFYNESQALPGCLQAIRRLDYPVERLAVLLVDDGSTDDSGRIAQSVAASLPHWATLHLPANVGKAAALNEAIRYYPHAPFLVVYDADERPQPDSLRLLLTGFGDEQVGGVTGRRVIGNGLNSAAATYATYENLVHQHLTCQAKETLHLYPPLLGSNCAYRLTALTAVGGFRPGAALEDSDLTIRLVHAGWQTRYLPQAISTTRAPETLAGYVAQHRRWAKGFVDVAHGEFRVSSFRFQVSGFGFQVGGGTDVGASGVVFVCRRVSGSGGIVGTAVYLAYTNQANPPSHLAHHPAHTHPHPSHPAYTNHGRPLVRTERGRVLVPPSPSAFFLPARHHYHQPRHWAEFVGYNVGGEERR